MLDQHDYIIQVEILSPIWRSGGGGTFLVSVQWKIRSLTNTTVRPCFSNYATRLVLTICCYTCYPRVRWSIFRCNSAQGRSPASKIEIATIVNNNDAGSKIY